MAILRTRRKGTHLIRARYDHEQEHERDDFNRVSGVIHLGEKSDCHV